MRSILIASLVAYSLGGVAIRAQAQSGATAETLIKQGISQYDQGQYQQAIASYEQALKLEPTNSTAQYELALTYNATNRNDEAVALCKRLLKQDATPGAEVYGTYGNALDGLRKPKEAVKIYEEGLKKYPNDGPLYYNMGVTQASSLNQLEAAIASMQQSVRCREAHANSHAALASLTTTQGNRIPALLETVRLLELEAEGKRAAASLAALDKMMGQGVQQTGEKSFTINLPMDMVKDVGRKNAGPDNFAAADMLLTLASALDHDEKNKDKSATERFIEKFSSLCKSLEENKPEARTGFVWQYYVPYFVELEKRGHVPALAYAIQASRAENVPEVKAWLSEHPVQVQALRQWSSTYIWPK